MMSFRRRLVSHFSLSIEMFGSEFSTKYVIIQAEIERLQKEGSKQVEEEIAFVEKQIREQLHSSSKSTKSSTVEDFRIKIKWKEQKDDPSNGGYNYDNLHKMFSKVR